MPLHPSSLSQAAGAVPPHAWFLVSAIFHYLGPAFAVLLFPAVGVLGVAWLRIASAGYRTRHAGRGRPQTGNARGVKDFEHTGGKGLMHYPGQCHCGAIRVELRTDRPPSEQILGACQCSFCRKHNARTFSDPRAHVTLIAAAPEQVQRYSFGLETSEQIVCRRCGVYVAMTLTDGPAIWSVINVDALSDRVLFTRVPEPCDYSAED